MNNDTPADAITQGVRANLHERISTAKPKDYQSLNGELALALGWKYDPSVTRSFPKTPDGEYWRDPTGRHKFTYPSYLTDIDAFFSECRRRGWEIKIRTSKLGTTIVNLATSGADIPEWSIETYSLRAPQACAEALALAIGEHHGN